MNRCTSVCYAKRIDLARFRERFPSARDGTQHREVLHIQIGGGHAFLFDYGVMVRWSIPDDAMTEFAAALAASLVDAHPAPLADDFTFEAGAAENRIHRDHISLVSNEVLALLAVSHGLAQSSKLEEFESYALQTIEETARIPRNVAETGKVGLPRKVIARMRGRLFLVETDINLNFGLLDTPEFFWEYPELEDLYTMTARYLDVVPRTEVLNRKLTIIHDLFGMLADEQKHKHSSMLEWIIIWLIAIEIAIFIFHDYLGLF